MFDVPVQTVDSRTFKTNLKISIIASKFEHFVKKWVKNEDFAKKKMFDIKMHYLGVTYVKCMFLIFFDQ